MKNFCLFLFAAFCLNLPAQSTLENRQENLVPNPGFELYSSPPIGWFYKGDHYTRVMKYWSAATTASPDIFGPRVRVPAHWADKGFGKQTPRSGHSMSGVTVYGCDKGKPHCREYIQIQLAEPLVEGQNYEVAMWVNHLPRSLLINNLGFFFSEKKIREPTDGVLDLHPQVNEARIIDASKGKWVRVSGMFKAEQEANFLVIGNFFPDSLTAVRTTGKDPLLYAYYYLDDVSVKKLPPILPVPVKEDDLTKVHLEKGKVVPLKNIFFEFDKSELLPRSFVELKKLLKIMRDNPKMVIEIRGHTDSKGEDDYNLPLSEKRAKAVMRYLTENGISEHRAHYRGLGSSEPMASNQTPKGRQMNRRVEFLILQK
jgi:OmpA-OmpF porin, OOP family